MKFIKVTKKHTGQFHVTFEMSGEEYSKYIDTAKQQPSVSPVHEGRAEKAKRLIEEEYMDYITTIGLGTLITPTDKVPALATFISDKTSS